MTNTNYENNSIQLLRKVFHKHFQNSSRIAYFTRKKKQEQGCISLSFHSTRKSLIHVFEGVSQLWEFHSDSWSCTQELPVVNHLRIQNCIQACTDLYSEQSCTMHHDWCKPILYCWHSTRSNPAFFFLYVCTPTVRFSTSNWTYIPFTNSTLQLRSTLPTKESHFFRWNGKD